MNPIYKFLLNYEINGRPIQTPVKPLYKDGLSKVYELEQNEMFFREKLNGKLLFVRNDYKAINNAPFETKFSLTVIIQSDEEDNKIYWSGEFWKTDCEIDEDNETIEVSPKLRDSYTNVLAGLEKEYDLIKLKPEIENITIRKRPLIQIYIPNENVVSCFLSGMYWEQDANEVTGDLETDYHFALNKSQELIKVAGSGVADGIWVNGKSPNGDFYFERETKQDGAEQPVYYTYITRISDKKRFFVNFQYHGYPSSNFYLYKYPYEEGALGVVKVSNKKVTSVYARYVLDTPTIAGKVTYPIPADDITNNRNYKRAIGYAIPDVIYFSSRTTKEPTEWGLAENGEYYAPPYVIDIDKFYPVGRSHWGEYSIWFAFSAFDWIQEESGRQPYKLRDAYPLSSAISVLLKEIAPNITHKPEKEYSEFLYGNYNPISGDKWRLFLTQKSNILKGNYDQPAQKAPITLKMITDMLRDCFCCYWYIENNKFKIEHIKFFKNGGSYYTSRPAIVTDLTNIEVTRNGKPWAYQTSKYRYDKQDMPERYQFGWMDDVTEVFEGIPINVLSKYVKEGEIKEVRVNNITTDIDYMLLNPEECSNDGFALMAAVEGQSGCELPFVPYNDESTEYVMQNGYLAFVKLQPDFYGYDMPAYNVEVNGKPYYAYGIKRNKKQTVRFPMYKDINPIGLIKTDIGIGQIEKISVNLSSRNAEVTLKYDTEQ